MNLSGNLDDSTKIKDQFIQGIIYLEKKIENEKFGINFGPLI